MQESTIKIVCRVWVGAVCCEALCDVTCCQKDGEWIISTVWMRQFADAGGAFIDLKNLLPSDEQKIIKKVQALGV